MGLTPESLGFKRKVLNTFLGNITIMPNGCWLWTGTKNKNGYGQFRIRGKQHYAHRISYQLFKGEIPKGFEPDHLCKTPLCINFDHMEAVTHKVNLLRSRAISVVNASKTHCTNGHPFNDENTYFYHDKGGNVVRWCRTCRRITAREADKKKKTSGGLLTA